MQLSFDFTNRPAPHHVADSNDYHRVPASDKQLRFAKAIAKRIGAPVPEPALSDRARLSEWIDSHKTETVAPSQFEGYPSSKQVAFAERIARIKRRAVPNACFKDRKLMSRWIDSNL